MLPSARQSRAIKRSLRTYHGDCAQRDAIDLMYRPFIQPGDLVFDVGAHVGDRTSSFRRLGARVVAVEPQPALSRILELIHGQDPMVTIERVAAGREPGCARMMINLDNPTVSTLSDTFVQAAKRADGWEGQQWNEVIDVAVVTLDSLIEKHGLPAFIKLDVEGFEAEALAGLSTPARSLSFEFTTIQREVANACISRCLDLGYRKFNVSVGESRTFLAKWIEAAELSQWFAELPDSANSGDVYCTL